MSIIIETSKSITLKIKSQKILLQEKIIANPQKCQPLALWYFIKSLSIKSTANYIAASKVTTYS